MTRLAPLALFLAAMSFAACGQPPAEEPQDASTSQPDSSASTADASQPAADASAQPADASQGTATDAEVVVAADAAITVGDTGLSPADLAAAAEQKTAAKLDTISGDPALLTPFIKEAPKGGDLHHHLSGAVYAETYLEWAKAENYCVNTSTLALAYSCSSSTVPVPSPGDALYTQLVEAWSMENFQPGGSEDGHDHFFATFGKYGPISGAAHHGKMLADVMKRADTENESYIELMLIAGSKAGTFGEDLWKNLHSGATFGEGDFNLFRQELITDSGWAGAIQPILDDVKNAENEARQILGCATAQPHSACRVATRYEVYVSRSGATTNVFTQIVAAYEAGKQEPRLVGVNLVGPEDGSTALSRYDIEMKMLGNLKAAYAGRSPVRISLHAGELAAKYMPSNWNIGSINHVRKAVEVAGAERIGHGIDILSESDPQGLMATMSSQGIAVEICLSSNIQILEVSGTNHPLSAYLAAKVPVSLATDDQAVSRSSIAGEWMRAVQDQHLSYRQLKALARNSLQYSFLPGQSLFTKMDPLTADQACEPTATSLLGDDAPGSDCAALLAASARATAQWELEKRFRVFEAAQ
ncbi:MAG: hypothetical protein QM765_15800 [Myxococcales bacterium]